MASLTTNINKSCRLKTLLGVLVRHLRYLKRKSAWIGREKIQRKNSGEFLRYTIAKKMHLQYNVRITGSANKFI